MGRLRGSSSSARSRRGSGLCVRVERRDRSDACSSTMLIVSSVVFLVADGRKSDPSDRGASLARRGIIAVLRRRLVPWSSRARRTISRGRIDANGGRRDVRVCSRRDIPVRGESEVTSRATLPMSPRRQRRPFFSTAHLRRLALPLSSLPVAFLTTNPLRPFVYYRLRRLLVYAILTAQSFYRGVEWVLRRNHAAMTAHGTTIDRSGDSPRGAVSSRTLRLWPLWR